MADKQWRWPVGAERLGLRAAFKKVSSCEDLMSHDNLSQHQSANRIFDWKSSVLTESMWKIRLSLDYNSSSSSSTSIRTYSLSYPPPINTGGGGVRGGGLYWNLSARLQFCLCVRSCPLNISWTAQPFLFFLPNVVWWCIITRRCVMWKSWFTIFNVKLTARA